MEREMGPRARRVRLPSGRSAMCDSPGWNPRALRAPHPRGAVLQAVAEHVVFSKRTVAAEKGEHDVGRPGVVGTWDVSVVHQGGVVHELDRELRTAPFD